MIIRADQGIAFADVGRCHRCGAWNPGPHPCCAVCAAAWRTFFLFAHVPASEEIADLLPACEPDHCDIEALYLDLGEAGA